MPSSATLFYDADCGFRRWSLPKVLAWDRRGALRPLALTSDEAHRVLAGAPWEESMASWHLGDPEGELPPARRG